MPWPEKILIAGAGITGLGAAIALAALGKQVTLIERDAPPPHDNPDTAFVDWQRRGVPQLRHSHVFLARLTNLLRDHYPQLRTALLNAGCRELTFADSLPAPLVANYQPMPEDDDFIILSSRRVTLELVMRAYALAQPNVTLLSGHRVTGLVMSDDRKPLRVTGLKVEHAEITSDITADVVIDATGQTSRFAKWLREAGARLREESAPAGIIYFTRHYRLRSGCSEPERSEAPTVGDLDYIKYGVFRADNGWFSITLSVPETEAELHRKILSPEIFDQICAQLPGVLPCTDASRAEPMSEVFSMGGLQSVWRHYVNGGIPAALGFFASGDSVIRSNPLYGRGCSAGFLQAHMLAQIIAHYDDPMRRAREFDAAQNREIRPYYDFMVAEDRKAIRRAITGRDPVHRPALKSRLTKRFIMDALRPATRGDIDVFRALMRGFHMLEDPKLALRNPKILLNIFRVWSQGPVHNAHLRPPRLGPEREQMLAELGIKRV